MCTHGCNHRKQQTLKPTNKMCYVLQRVVHYNKTLIVARIKQPTKKYKYLYFSLYNVLFFCSYLIVYNSIDSPKCL